MKKFDQTKPSKYISFLDLNNFYDFAKSGYLPYGGFKLPKNVDSFDINSISENSSTWYILKNDLECPDKLHDLHHGY